LGRILAVDLGTRRVGLAITDPLQLIASPLANLTFSGEDRLVQDLLALASAKAVERVVVGLPLREDGSEGEGCRQARQLARRLESAGLEVSLWDERYSSREAQSALREMGYDRRRSLARIDPVAAAIILEDFLRSVTQGR
jgi:putative Holliday junction resolvase